MSIQLFKARYEVSECVEEIRKVLESGWSGQGPKCTEFEKNWSDLIGSEYAHFVSSATAALQIAMRLLDLPKGTPVATTPLTFVSSNAVILYEGCVPVFCDCGKDLSLKFESVVEAIEKKGAKAVMWVHYGGSVSEDFYKMMTYARMNSIKVIEDCAHASGAFYVDGTRVGSRKDTISCFSGNTTVLMADGKQVRLDKMDDSYIGKMVVGCVGNKCVPSRILGLVKNKKEHHLRVVLNDKTEFVCDEDHLFIIKRRDRWMDVPAKYLASGDVVGKPTNYRGLYGNLIGIDEWLVRSGACFKLPKGKRFSGETSGCRLWERDDGYSSLGAKHSSNRYDFSKTTLKELCYVCGLVFSDGHVSGTSLRFTNTNNGLLKYVAEFSSRVLGREVSLCRTGGSTQNNCKTVLVGGKLLRAMYEWFVNNWSVFPKDGLMAFLSGIFDGDGSVYVSSDGHLQCSYATCDPNDTLLVESIMRSLGMDVFIQRLPAGQRMWKSGYVSETVESFIVRVFGEYASMVLDFGMIRHADKIRKYEKWDRKKSKDMSNNKDGDLCLREVKIIEDIQHEDWVYCINTETSNFIANGVLVHNCMSFHSVKNLPIMDGGMLCVPTKEMDERARRLSWMGIDKSTYSRTSGASNELYKWAYDVPELGWKFNGNDIAASIGIVQLKYLDRDNAYRRMLYDQYVMRLANTKSGIMVIPHEPGSSHHLLVVSVPDRDKTIAVLKANGFAPGVHYLPNYNFPVFSSFDHSLCGNIEKAWLNIVSLPNHLCLSLKDVDRVCEVLKSV